MDSNAFELILKLYPDTDSDLVSVGYRFRNSIIFGELSPTIFDISHMWTKYISHHSQHSTWVSGFIASVSGYELGVSGYEPGVKDTN